MAKNDRQEVSITKKGGWQNERENEKIEHFPKFKTRISDKKCRKIQKREQFIEPSEVKTLALDAALLKAAIKAGKQYGNEGLVSYLEAQAHVVPSAFLTLLGKILAREDEQKKPLITHIEIVAPQWNQDNKMELDSQE